MKKLFLLILLLSTFGLSFAQNADSVVRRAAASFLASGVPAGFSIGIVKNNITSRYNFGQLQKGHGVGFGDIDNDGVDVLIAVVG
ncbi:hypothetical protein EON73_01975, partial [bacterium]